MPHVASLMIADRGDFVTRGVPHLALTLDGIAGDRHAGPVRAADARTPWHKRGTPIANTRQLSIVSLEECEEIAALMEVDAVDPALLGANLVLGGIAQLSLLAPASRLQFPSGAVVFVTEHNAPCRYPAEKLAEAHGRPRLAATFARAAIGRRGLVGLVEREGHVAEGDTVRCFTSPAQVSAPKLAAPQRSTALA